jgi:SAM-dependent methyltransferase
MKLLLSSISKNFKELIDPRKFPFVLSECIKYLKDYRKYRFEYQGNYPIKSVPILFDRIPVSPFDPHYVYQAYWATNRITQKRLPEIHIDISSQVSYIAQLSALIPVAQVEFRPPNLRIESCNRISGDILNLPFADNKIMSLSCLHVIEHIGLGRYGDAINCDGCWKAFKEIKRVIARNGSLFLSVPVGKPTVYFNNCYVFNPIDVIEAFAGFEICEFSFIGDDGDFIEKGNINDTEKMEYALGLFHLKKL